jgi:hypothetical protein
MAVDEYRDSIASDIAALRTSPLRAAHARLVRLCDRV